LSKNIKSVIANFNPNAHVKEGTFAPKIQEEDKNLIARINKSRTEKFFPSMADMMIDINKIESAREGWNIFPTPPDNVYNGIKESIREQGQLNPIVVWEQKDGSYMCLGGHTRLLIFKELLLETGDEYYKKIKCHVYEENQIDEIDAQKIIIIDNATQRAQESPAVQREMVKACRQLFKKTESKKIGIKRKTILEDIADYLDMSVTTVKYLSAQDKVIQPLLELGDSKTITQSLVNTFARIPTELQEHIYEKELWKKELDGCQLKELPGAVTVEDVDSIYNKAKRYQFKAEPVILSHAIPRSFKKFSLAADKEDMEKLIPKLSKVISEMDDIKAETKDTLIEILEAYK